MVCICLCVRMYVENCMRERRYYAVVCLQEVINGKYSMTNSSLDWSSLNSNIYQRRINYLTSDSFLYHLINIT